MEPEVLAFLNILVLIVSSWLQDAKLKPWLNAVIAGGALLLIGLLTAWLNGFSSDLKQNVVLVLVSISAAIIKFVELARYLYKLGSPLPAAPLHQQTDPMPVPTQPVAPTLYTTRPL